ncbi:MAG: Holliday junction branch migration protein RuvA [Clostridia bacterium]|nr:Holliday junction branch migration protein RuvA [Clostridia bacterium]
MIAYLKGKVIDVFEDGVVMENNGVGYEVLCSSAALCKLSLGREGELFTYMQVKEDGISLYGFDTKEEKRMFLKLISVSGVGPKIGIAALAGMELKDLVTAIATSDVKTLSKVKGLGKKTAERIILELREGVGKDELTVISDFAPAREAESKEAKDAIIALTGLGFNATESKKAVASAIESGAKSIEDIIAYALRGLSR